MADLTTRSGKGSPLTNAEVDANFTNLNTDKVETGLAALDAYDTTIADTAVDVFVYDTSRDSDGGAWRHRTQHTSWYNETLNTATRGSRREFPAVAVIVAESNQVTIYDGDDPSLPMWMVFDGASGTTVINMLFNYNNPRPFTCCFMLNSQLVVGTTTNEGALSVIDFIRDNGKQYNGSAGLNYYKGNIEQRNDGLGFGPLDTTYQTVARTNNDVAMTVLPNAPIDAATGLPVPTIAVATGGGVSVIKDDGTVVDITSDAQAGKRIQFLPDNKIDVQFTLFGGDTSKIYTIPATDLYSGVHYTKGNAEEYYTERSNADLRVPHSRVGTYFNVHRTAFGNTLAYGSGGFSGGGVYLIERNKITPSEGMVDLITSTYNTGWMNGNIKLATLSDTDDTDVTGSELVTNGTFDTDTDWVKETAAWSISAGVASCDGTQTSGTGLYQDGVLTPGSLYVLTFDVTVSAGSIAALFGQPGGLNLTGFLNSSQTVTVTGIAPSAPAANTRLLFVGDSNFVGTVDNVSVRLAVPDRSVNGNGLGVYGTITKSPVATGADLVAYSGFSNSNYLQQPYNSDLDFGTGDFCVMGWMKAPVGGTGTTRYIFERSDGTVGTAVQLFLSTSTNQIGYRVGTVASTTTITVPADSWSLVALVRRSGQLYVYANGVEEVEAASTSNLTSATATSAIGVRVGGLGYFNGSLALLRISATAPTAEQIAKIYEDEKFLFQEDAQATLYGSSDAVTALAHDPVTDLLHVGTSAGRSVFQGLRRVENTTDAVGVAISAVDSLVAED